VPLVIWFRCRLAVSLALHQHQRREVIALGVGFPVGRLFRSPFNSIGDEVSCRWLQAALSAGSFARLSPASATR
jgi:hypothetical protein